MQYKKLGPFITQVFINKILIHTSRSLRKSLHQPKTISYWISILFMVGATLFVIPSILLIYPFLDLSSNNINTIYFIGSILFTSAAYLQYLESINSDITNKLHINQQKTNWLWFKVSFNNLGYLSSLSQFIGTIFFNFNTFDSLLNPIYIDERNILIWTPNILGSILFLVSSFLAWLEIYHDTNIKSFKTNTWWTIWINILGSILFLISALYSFNFQSGDNINFDIIAIWTTLLGAICFFLSAFLMHFEKITK